VSKLKAIIDSAKRAGVDKSQPPPQMPDEAARQAIRPTEKTIDDFSNEDSFYRIVDEDAYIDLVNSGAVRTNFGNKPGSTIKDKLASRPTRYPSFSKGSANKTYAEGKPNHYIIETKDPSIKPSTEGRHGKGTTQFPTDSTGVHLESLPGEAVQVYRHIGDGQYRLVYDQGKVTPNATNAETKVAAPLGNISIPIAAAIAAGTMTPEEAQAGPGAKALAELAKRADAGDQAAVEGIRAYHGSPYSFDEFSTSQIGTGEGAQAYGRGLYFAEAENVAKGYRDQLSEGLGTVDGESIGGWAAEILDNSKGDPSALRARINMAPDDFWVMNFEEGIAAKDNLLGVVDRLESGVSTWRPGGHMYEVDIDATPDDFLDYDKPLSEQSDRVKEALGIKGQQKKLLALQAKSNELQALYDKALSNVPSNQSFDDLFGDSAALRSEGELLTEKNRIDEEIKLLTTPKDFQLGDRKIPISVQDYFSGANLIQGQGAASEISKQLLDKGIKGIKYLDQGSRAAGKGTSNYVVFDDKLISIAKKYGVSIPIAAYIAEGIITPEEAQAGVISIPTQGIRSLGQTLEFDPRFDPRKREQEGLQSLQFDFLPRNEAMIKPSLRLSDLEGEDFVTSMSDRTRAGGMIMGINGVPLYRAVDLRGGQDFMFENPNQVWASARVPSEKILEMAREFQGQSGKDPLFIPWRMAPTGGDFSNMVGELMLGFASSNMDKATKKAFDVAIREYKTKGSMDKGVRKNAGLKIKEWPGVDDPKAVEIWRSTPDAVRKELMNMMDVQFRNKGGLSIGSARLVASDPTQLMSRDAGLQNVGRIYTGQDITPSTHPSYPYAVPGEGIGTLKGADEVTIFDLLPEARFGDAQKKVKDPANPTQQEIRALQMKPYGGTITENILRRIEERGVNVNSLTGLTPGALAFTLTSAGLLTPEEAAAGGLDEAAEIFSGTKGGKGVTSRAMPDEVAFKAPREPRRIPEKQPPGIASLAGQLGLGAMSEIGGAILGGLSGAAEYVRGSGPSMGGMAGAPATGESIRNINEGVSGYVGDLYDAGPEAQALGQQIMQGIGETIAPIAEYAMEGDITDEYGINMLPLLAQKLGIPLYELLERVYSMMPEREQEALKSGADAFL
jgi:hypothetical protein